MLKFGQYLARLTPATASTLLPRSRTAAAIADLDQVDAGAPQCAAPQLQGSTPRHWSP